MPTVRVTNFREPGNRVKLTLVAAYSEAFKVPNSIDELQKHLSSKWKSATVHISYKNPCYPLQPVEFHVTIHITITSGSAAIVVLGAVAKEAFRWLRERFRLELKKTSSDSESETAQARKAWKQLQKVIREAMAVDRALAKKLRKRQSK